MFSPIFKSLGVWSVGEWGRGCWSPTLVEGMSFYLLIWFGQSSPYELAFGVELNLASFAVS